MLLEEKVALVHAAGGQIGRRVAEQFAREGAHVWLAGRDTAKIEPLVDTLRTGGAKVDVIAIDALSASSVDDGTARVARAAGRLDVVFNGIAVGPVSSTIGPATEISADTFLESFRTVVLSQFLTARAAARHMLAAKQGSIVLLTATPGRGVAPFMAGPEVLGRLLRRQPPRPPIKNVTPADPPPLPPER